MQRNLNTGILKGVILPTCRGAGYATIFAVVLNFVLAHPAHAGTRDPAPVNDEVVKYVHKAINAGGKDRLISSIDLRMDEATALLDRIGNYQNAGDEKRRDETRDLLRSKAAEFRVLKREALNRLSANPKIGASSSTEPPAMQVGSRFERITAALDQLANADSRHINQALSHARKVFEELRSRNQPHLDVIPEPVPTWTQGKPTTVKPEDLSRGPKPQYLTSNRITPGNNVYAFLGNTLLAALPDPVATEASTCEFVAADLAENLEIKLTPEIRALAEKLQYSPVKIYEYVSKEIAYEPYFGSLKGAMGTLVSKAGGPTDQASLLIALLRASNIPARYVRGTAQFINDDRVLQWIGAKDYYGALGILAAGKIPVSLDTAAKKLWLDHVWVEACVPYGNYRGTKVDKTGHRWIPLDPSFKEKTYQSGIVVNVNFDYTTYLAKRQNGPDSLPHEAYARQVEAAVKTLAPNYQNNTIEDVAYLGKQVPRNFDILPASLPYQVDNFTNWNTTTLLSSETAEVPDDHRYKLEISGANLPGTLSLVMPQISLNRVTLGFDPWRTTGDSYNNDKANLDEYRRTGIIPIIYAGPAWSTVPIYVNTVIRVDGVAQMTGSQFNIFGSTSSTSLVPLSLTMNVTLGGSSACNGDGNPCNTGTFGNIKPANIHALFANAFQTSDELLRRRADRLLNNVRTISDPNSNLDETIGEYLHLVGLKFMRYVDDSSKSISALDGGSGWNGNHIGLTSTVARTQYVFDLPYSLSTNSAIRGMLVDFPGGQIRNVDLKTGNPVWKTFLLSGYAGSALESYIWQENGRADAVSTVRGLQYAKEKNIEILSLYKSSPSLAADTQKLTSNTDSTLNYSAATVSQINGYVADGYKLTLPRSLIYYDNVWKGAVWVQEHPISGVGYIISGNYAGGYLVSLMNNLYNPVTDTGYYCVDPNYVDQFGDSTPAYLNQWINFGITSGNTYSNDPVNMVTGNMYHIERDIELKSRGGLPIVFERSYNSRDNKDGPLGFGWTHSFNQYLTFEDNNQNAAVDSADTDGLTSSAIWTDSTGARKFIQVNGTAAGVAINSVFTPLNGHYFQTTRNTDGTYTIREKNGLTYKFESIAGTNGQKARLLSITDRNGNSHLLSYTPNANCNGTYVCTVTDGMNRSLTFSYDTGNHITEIKDWDNRSFQYGYTDGNNNLTFFKNPLAVAGTQNPVLYEYYTADPQLIHSMKSFILPRGNGMTFVYYTNGKVFKHTNTAGETTTFTYNDFRRESVVTNARGHVRRFYFDSYGMLIKLVEENGAQREYTYDPVNPGNRLSKRDPMGYVTTYDYDANGNITTTTNPSGGTIKLSDFNSFNQPGKEKDARGNYTLMKYDAKGNLTDRIVLRQGIGANIVPSSYTPVAEDMIAWIIYTYDSYGNRLTSKRVRDFNTAAGPIWTQVYDSTNFNVVNIKRQGDMNGDGTLDDEEISPTLVYDGLGQAMTDLDTDWYAIDKEYDAVGRITRMTDSVGNLRDYQYDHNGNPTGQSLTLSGALQDSSFAQYDVSDRKTASIDAAGNATTYLYDSVGNLTKITNPDNYSLAFEYDEANHVVKAYDEEGHAVTKTLDLDGKPRTVTDPNGNTLSYEYYSSERDGRLKKQIDAALRATTFDYDPNGNVISVTDNLGRTTLTSYDEMNRAYRVVGPAYTDATLGQIRPVTRYTFNNLGNLATVAAGHTDSSGTNETADQVTLQMAYAYDDFGRKIKETDPLGKFWTFEYDTNNNLTKTTDAKGQITQFTWDYGHQMRVRTDHTGKITSTLRNPLGQPTTVQSPDVTYSYAYDTAHRVKRVTDGRGGKALNYTWSPGGLLNEMVDSDGNSTNYLYDPVGRLSAIWAANDDVMAFVYDAGGRLAEKWFPNGVNTQYTWNPDNTLGQIKNRTDTNDTNVISKHDYTYNGVGQRNTSHEKIGATILQASNETYSYDPIGNRLSKSDGTTQLYYQYDAANQLTEIHQTDASGPLLAAMIYDANGSLVSKCEGSSVTTTGASCSGSIITSFGYNALNQLVQIDKTGQPTQTYAYDDQGRRIRKSIGGSITQYLYNGMNIHGEYNTWSKASALYTHGTSVDDPLARFTDNDILYYHKGGLGSIVATTNSTGTVDGMTSYDAWGNTTGNTGNIPQYGYTGREPDETGLIYYRARYYDPTTGRFTQRDPIGFEGGLNQYAYVGDDPVNYTDPSGLVNYPKLGFAAIDFATSTSEAALGLGMMIMSPVAGPAAPVSYTVGAITAVHGEIGMINSAIAMQNAINDTSYPGFWEYAIGTLFGEKGAQVGAGIDLFMGFRPAAVAAGKLDTIQDAYNVASGINAMDSAISTKSTYTNNGSEMKIDDAFSTSSFYTNNNSEINMDGFLNKDFLFNFNGVSTQTLSGLSPGY